MIKSLRIIGFRKYKDLTIDGFKRVNVILGANNVGKTSILEAIYAWACGQNISPFLNVPLSRGRYSINQTPYWIMEEILAMANNKRELPLNILFEGIDFDNKKTVFSHTIYPSELLTEYDSSYKKSIEQVLPATNNVVANPSGGQVFFPIIQQQTLVARWDIKSGKNVKSVNITSPFNNVPDIKPYMTAKYIDILSHTAISEGVQIYSSLKREGILNEVVSNMQEIFPEIVGIDTLPYPDGSQAPLTVLKKDGSYLPIYAFGDGLQRWFYILGAIELYKNSAICIDEFDIGFHPYAQKQFCMSLLRYAERNNVQLFLTTHNIEFIDNFISGAEECDNCIKENIGILTIKDDNQSVSSRMLSLEEAKEARENYNLELR